jgi:GntR family transcriptional regulator
MYSMKGKTLFIVISHTNPDPLYKQVTDQIKDSIADGVLRPEAKLPSIREMAKELQISPITIKRAYRDLENEGFIVTRTGIGSYVAPLDREKMKTQKIAEVRFELRRLLGSAKRFGIGAEGIKRIIDEIVEGNSE